MTTDVEKLHNLSDAVVLAKEKLIEAGELKQANHHHATVLQILQRARRGARATWLPTRLVYSGDPNICRKKHCGVLLPKAVFCGDGKMRYICPKCNHSRIAENT